MTCFWTGIISSLTDSEIKQYGLSRSPRDFIIKLQALNSPTENALWCGMGLSNQQLEENVLHVKNYNVDAINGGYDCSTCDPFLLLVCELFNLTIEHNYNGTMIKYSHITPKRTVRYHSNSSHFQHL